MDSPDTPPETLTPPFEKKHQCFGLDESVSHNNNHDDGRRETQTEEANATPEEAVKKITLPAAFFEKPQNDLDKPTYKVLQMSQIGLVCGFLDSDLDVSSINRIHKHLWFAGQERPPRPLHLQQLVGREIVLSENTNHHLLWKSNTIFVKPCPEYLLSHQFWEKYICIDPQRFENALGLLRSYVWLILNKSDLRKAHETGILPEDITWTKWNQLSMDVLKSEGNSSVNPRYDYGELRINRINWIYRFCSKVRSPNSIARGFVNNYHGYGSLFQHNVVWVTGTTVYIALVLTAMQVGLSLDSLSGSRAFVNACYGFTIFAILGPLVVITVLVIIVMGYIMIVNLVHTLRLAGRKDQKEREKAVWKSQRMSEYKH